MLNFYGTIFSPNSSNVVSIVVIKLKVEIVTLQNVQFKEEKKVAWGGWKKMRKFYPSKGFGSLIDQHDNHYTTPIADSINEIK